MLTRSLLSAVFCLLLIALQPLPVEAESILPDGRTTTTMRPWLDKRARQWLDAREPLTVGVVSPDYPPLSIFYAGSYKGFTADYLALVFERPLRVRDFPSRQAAIDALSQGEIDLLGVGSEVEARQHGLLASAAYLSDRPYWCLPAVPRSIRRRSPGWPRSRAIFPPNVSRLLSAQQDHLVRLAAACPGSAEHGGCRWRAGGRSFHALPHPDPLPAELAHRELRTHRQPGFPFPAPAR